LAPCFGIDSLYADAVILSAPLMCELGWYF
jgi:hypothetical protein